MIFAAIDPGSVNAGIAVFHNEDPVFVDDIRSIDGMIDAAVIAHALSDMKVERVVVENVHAMPKQGLSSTFKFGMACGIIRGVAGALRLPLTPVTPQTWKAFHGLKNRPDKASARALAMRKWPDLAPRLQRVRDTDRAEALLIGDWYFVQCLIPRREALFT